MITRSCIWSVAQDFNLYLEGKVGLESLHARSIFIPSWKVGGRNYDVGDKDEHDVGTCGRRSNRRGSSFHLHNGEIYKSSQEVEEKEKGVEASARHEAELEAIIMDRRNGTSGRYSRARIITASTGKTSPRAGPRPSSMMHQSGNGQRRTRKRTENTSRAQRREEKRSGAIGGKIEGKNGKCRGRQRDHERVRRMKEGWWLMVDGWNVRRWGNK